MARQVYTALSVLALIALGASSRAQVLADSATGFSGTQGLNGWTYGYYDQPNTNTHFVQLPTFNGTSWIESPTPPPWTFISATLTHPNGFNEAQEQWSVRRWTSDFAGVVDITGHLAKQNTAGGTGIFGEVFVDASNTSSPVYNHYIVGTDGVGVDFNFLTTVSVGSVVDFVVKANGFDTYDTTLYTATISEVSGTPEPGSLAFLAGFMVTGLYAGKRRANRRSHSS